MDKIIGMGNALVDVLVTLQDDSLLDEMSLPKGSMQLINGSNIEYNPKFLGKIKKALKFQCLYRSFYFHWLKQSG